MKGSFFSIDNPIFNAISRIGDMCLLSFLWVLSSFPIITIGASTTALYDVAIKILRGRDTGTIKGFIVSFKNNFKKSTIIWSILLPIGVMLYFDITYLFTLRDAFAILLGGISCGLALLYLSVLLYIFAVQAVFENTIKGTFRTAYLTAVKHIPTTLLLLLCVAGLVYICDIIPAVSLLMLLVGIGMTAMIFSVRILTIFKKYDSSLAPEESQGKDEPILQVLKKDKKESQNKTSIKIKSGKVIK